MPFYYCTYMLLPNSTPTSNCILSQNYKSCRLNTVGKYKTKLLLPRVDQPSLFSPYSTWCLTWLFRICYSFLLFTNYNTCFTITCFSPVFREISADDRRRVSKFLVYLLWHASDCGAKFLLRFIFVFPLVLAWTHL